MILQMRDICKDYPMGKTVTRVLKNVSLDVNEGDYLAIMGPSGSGKTTLMNLIGCLDVPTSGSYLLGEREITKCSGKELAEVRNKEIGFVFQSFHLLPKLTALDNVALPLLYGGVKKAERLEPLILNILRIGAYQILFMDKIPHRAAVNEAVADGEIDYQNFVIFDKDDTGHITALRSNVAEVNRMQGRIADEILARLAEVSTSELEIPLGTLTGSALLAGRGPCLHVRMQSVGTATARFDNQFSSSGINQTRHRIILDVDVHVSILLPGLTTYTKVSNEISVAETVIVGGVPETYTYFSTTPDEIENYADEYIINNG